MQTIIITQIISSFVLVILFVILIKQKRIKSFDERFANFTLKENPLINPKSDALITIKEEDLHSFLTVLYNHLNNGLSVTSSLKKMQNDNLDFIADILLEKLNEGLNISMAFTYLAKKTNLPLLSDISYFLTVTEKINGKEELALMTIIQNIKDKIYQNKEKDILRSIIKFVSYIILFIPILTLGIIILINNTFFFQILTTLKGIIYFILIILIYLIYLLIVKFILGVSKL